MSPWGSDYKAPLDSGIKSTKPADASGGLKTDKYSGEMTADVKTGTATAASGAENICGVGTVFAPELSALFAGEL